MNTYGTTFSHLLIKRLGRDPQEDLKTVIARGFHPIRLGIYWTEVEPQRDIWDFSGVAELLAICEKSHIPVVLTIGAKAPRWPEFFIPDHSKGDWQNRVVILHEKAYVALHGFTCIKWIQVENEPFDPSGPEKKYMPYRLVKQEKYIAKSLWHKPIIVSVWGNSIPFRWSIWKTLLLGDIIGIDMYYKVPGPAGTFYAPALPDWLLRLFMRLLGRRWWIMELQGEPWRPAYPTDKEYVSYRSRARKLGAEKILIWGSEYELEGKPDDWSGAI